MPPACSLPPTMKRPRSVNPTQRYPGMDLADAYAIQQLELGVTWPTGESWWVTKIG